MTENRTIKDLPIITSSEIKKLSSELQKIDVFDNHEIIGITSSEYAATHKSKISIATAKRHLGLLVSQGKLERAKIWRKINNNHWRTVNGYIRKS